MFEGGVPDQFHQFIASRASLPLPLSFPPALHGSASNTPPFTSFDLYSTNCTPQVPLQHPNFLHSLHQGSSNTPSCKHEEKQDNNNNNNLVAVNLEVIERERSVQDSVDPWSNDEVLALLRIRSSSDNNWFPEFIWEHVSRKLAELGFKRSAEKCKEKFEEESRYFSNINYNKSTAFRGFSELEELYHGDQNPHQGVNIAAEKCKRVDKPREEEGEEDKICQNVEEDSRIDQSLSNPIHEDEQVKEVEKSKSKKRKRQKKFEMFKGLCEDFVNKMMAQQEDTHNKIIEDMKRRDEEKLTREESWKKQEMDRISKEHELRAHEQALAGDRQATIINYLKKFTSPSSLIGTSIEILSNAQDLGKANNSPHPSATSSSLAPVPPINPSNSSCQAIDQNKLERPSTAEKNPTILNSLIENQEAQNPSSSLALASKNPNSLNDHNSPSLPNPLPSYTVHAKATINDNKEDIGKRWPRDEVLALINLRCKLYNSNEEKEGAAKAPLWERISRGMMELGYKRSAKRCKEKWENINKYFRKTKDVNKKRSVHSRTCPYFHQLSTLYNQGTLVAPENHSGSPENQPPETRHSATSAQNVQSNSAMHVAEGEKNVVHQVPAFDFEF